MGILKLCVVLAWLAASSVAVPSLARADCAQPDEIQRLIRELGDEDPIARSAAASDLEDCGPPAVPPLLRVLQGAARPRTRQLVIQVLAALGKGNPAVISALGRELGHQEASVRDRSAYWLTTVDTAGQTVPHLVRALDDKEEDVLQSAVIGLGQLGALAASAVPRLIRMLDEAGEKEKSSSLPGGGWHWPLADWVIDALGRIGPPAAAAAPALVKILDDSTYPQLQVLAAYNLGKLGDRVRAVPALERAARSTAQDGRLARAAREALQAIRSPAGRQPPPAEPVVTIVAPSRADLRQLMASLLEDAMKGGWRRSLPGQRRPRVRFTGLRNRGDARVDAAIYRLLNERREVLRVGVHEVQADFVLSGFVAGADAEDQSTGRELLSYVYCLSLDEARSGRSVWIGLRAWQRVVDRGKLRLRRPGEKLVEEFGDLEWIAAGTTIADRLRRTDLVKQGAGGISFEVELHDRTSEHLSLMLFKQAFQREMIEAGVLLAPEKDEAGAPGREPPSPLPDPTHRLVATVASLTTPEGTGVRVHFQLSAKVVELATSAGMWTTVLPLWTWVVKHPW
jgi:HEAT repeat protein